MIMSALPSQKTGRVRGGSCRCGLFFLLAFLDRLRIAKAYEKKYNDEMPKKGRGS
jgi:hypothetical protein